MRALLAGLCILTLGLGGCIGKDEGAASLQVDGAYAFATTSVQKNGAVFFSVTNAGSDNRSIIAASSPVADIVELHTHSMDDGVMMMREVESYDVEAGGSVTLEPMGHHIMLMGLKEPLQAGTVFPLTLTTDNTVEIQVEVTVKNPGETH